MKTSRLWAHVQHYLLLLGVVCAGLSVASSAGAQSIEPQLWEFPGARPFTGTPLEACQLHQKTTGLPVEECLNGTKLHEIGMCEKGYFLQDGYLLHTTYTNNGKSRSVYVKVAFKYPKGHAKAGQPLPADDEKRYASRCALSRDDGATIVFPYVCGNWSVAYEKVVLPTVERFPDSVWVCKKYRFNGSVGNSVQYLQGFVSADCCCGSVTYTPGLIVDSGDTLQSSGYTEVCGWQNKD